MEESKPHIRRTPSGTSRPVRRASPGGSSHVIDLRANKASSATAPAPSPVRKTVPAKAPARPLAAPNQSSVPAAPAVVSKPSSQPKAPAAQAPTTALAPTLEPALSGRRFWPAFWRFLLLLVVLGILVSGGFYLYINYYRG